MVTAAAPRCDRSIIPIPLHDCWVLSHLSLWTDVCIKQTCVINAYTMHTEYNCGPWNLQLRVGRPRRTIGKWLVMRPARHEPSQVTAPSPLLDACRSPDVYLSHQPNLAAPRQLRPKHVEPARAAVHLRGRMLVAASAGISALAAQVVLMSADLPCNMEPERLRPRMHAVIGPWPKRAIAAVAALALVLAAIIGAYGHASAHGGEHDARHAGDQHAGHQHGAPAGEPGSSDHTDHATCLDTICHGGLVVVAVAVISSAPRPAMPPLGWSRALCGALSQLLERPPRPTGLF
jgi:hypothetical protein